MLSLHFVILEASIWEPAPLLAGYAPKRCVIARAAMQYFIHQASLTPPEMTLFEGARRVEQTHSAVVRDTRYPLRLGL